MKTGVYVAAAVVAMAFVAVLYTGFFGGGPNLLSESDDSQVWCEGYMAGWVNAFRESQPTDPGAPPAGWLAEEVSKCVGGLAGG